jgi:hypothetical protein
MLAVLADRPYAVLALLNTIMLLRMPVISLAIPPWIVERTHAPTSLVSAVLLLNTLAVMLWQVRVSRGVTGLRGASILVRRSGVLLLGSCAVFALSAADVPQGFFGTGTAVAHARAGAADDVDHRLGCRGLAAVGWAVPARRPGQRAGGAVGRGEPR